MTQHNQHDDIHLGQIAATLLRIVARLPKSEYHDVKSNGQDRQQAAESELDDLPDPASESDTAQG